MIIARSEDGKPVKTPELTVEIVDDPVECAKARAVFEQAGENAAWLQEHWCDLPPDAEGKFLVVAGKEMFIADTPQEASARARAAHPNDLGLIGFYISPHKGPRIYVNRSRKVHA